MLKKFQKKVFKKNVIIMSLLIIIIYSLHASELEQDISARESGQLFAPKEQDLFLSSDLAEGQGSMPDNKLKQKDGTRRRLREVKIFLFSEEHEKKSKENEERKRLAAEKEALVRLAIERRARQAREQKKLRDSNAFFDRYVLNQDTTGFYRKRKLVREHNGAQIGNIQPKVKLIHPQHKNRAPLPESCWDCLVGCCLGR